MIQKPIPSLSCQLAFSCLCVKLETSKTLPNVLSVGLARLSRGPFCFRIKNQRVQKSSRQPHKFLCINSAISSQRSVLTPKLILPQLRKLLKELGLQALVVANTDPHLSEYPPAHFNRREFVSGFTGSAGTALVTEKSAILWTDGRYFLLAEKELDENWKLMKGFPTLEEFLSENLPKQSVVGIDPYSHSVSFVENLSKKLSIKDIYIRLLDTNPVDLLWNVGRPSLPTDSIRIHPLENAGQSCFEKLEDIRVRMQELNVDMLLVSLLDEIAWVLNLRGSDIPHCPVFLAYFLVGFNQNVLYVNREKIPSSVESYLYECNIDIKPYEAILPDLKKFSQDNRKIWYDPLSTNAALGFACQPGGFPQSTPISLMKAVKNDAEIRGMREAHIRDGVALVHFLNWLETEGISNGVSEFEAAEKLLEFRSRHAEFVTESFPTICGSGPNGAIIHYRPMPSDARPLSTKELILLDSGGQYMDGTTDVTRTFHFGTPSEKQRECFTRVLQGHISLDTAIFPKGTLGCLLDSYARRKLWEYGLDYRHGTGHGIGAALNVHEGPHSISPRMGNNVYLRPGMFVSNEPGFYEDGEFGIRIENILLVVEKDTPFRFGDIPFYGFEAFTIVPIQQKMIKIELLEKHEIDWIDRYHSRVWKILNPRVEDANVKEWLWKSTRPILSTSDKSFPEQQFSTSRRSFLGFFCGLLVSSLLPKKKQLQAVEMDNESLFISKQENKRPKIDPKISEPDITSKCFFDLKVENRGMKRVVIGLYGGVAPKTSQLFADLCDCNRSFSYLGSEVFRVIEGMNIQIGRKFSLEEVGDYKTANYDFLEDCCQFRHNMEGLVSMVRTKPSKDLDYRFFISTAPAPYLDDKYVTFGKVMEGMDWVHEIERLNTKKPSNQPILKVKVVACGQQKL
ncbi:Probable Xaa-Pro aminopeptidase P [Galdieria sulphuraria]|nr:Probable Xaa-Pro aminopeptidase P [Galdieria sulphuraria]